MDCLHCGKAIVQGQYIFGETEEAFAEREESGFCRRKCSRDHGPVKQDRRRPLPLDAILISSLVGEGVVMTPQPKEKTPRDEGFRDWLRTFDCCECGWPAHIRRPTGGNFIEAHHILTGGTSIKASDYEEVPLCAIDARGCHANADKSPESVEKYKPLAAMYRHMWVAAGNELKV